MVSKKIKVAVTNAVTNSLSHQPAQWFLWYLFASQIPSTPINDIITVIKKSIYNTTSSKKRSSSSCFSLAYFIS